MKISDAHKKGEICAAALYHVLLGGLQRTERRENDSEIVENQVTDLLRYLLKNLD